MRIKRISSPEELKKAFAIRMRVFVREQHVPAEIELDSDDAKAVHFLVLVAGRAVGTARIVMGRGSAKIGRMAILKTHRRKGIGTRLLKRVIATARKIGPGKIYLHAQVPVIGFYVSMGFRPVGPIFDEAGIPHKKMILHESRESR